MRSNVVKRKPHRSHSLRRRMECPSSIGLESSTFVFLLSQFEHLNLFSPNLGLAMVSVDFWEFLVDMFIQFLDQFIAVSEIKRQNRFCCHREVYSCPERSDHNDCRNNEGSSSLFCIDAYFPVFFGD